MTLRAKAGRQGLRTRMGLRAALGSLVLAAALAAPTAASAQGGAAPPAPGNILEQISQATESAAARVGADESDAEARGPGCNRFREMSDKEQWTVQEATCHRTEKEF